MTTLLQGLIQLSGHPLVHALGWTLLHFCWQGAAVGLVLWCVLGLLGRRSSQARYGAACLGLGLMVVLPAATFAHVASAEYKARSAMLGSGVALDANLALQVGVDEPAAPWPARIGMALDRLLPWVLLAWFAGVILFAGRLNFGLLVARRLKTAGTEAPPAALLRLFENLRTRLGVARAVALLHSAQVQVPTVIGWLRPVVLLPASCLTGLSPGQIEAVLCHELAHVRRHDYLVSVIQSVIETVLFYHPAVWWVSRQVRRERECCCDELAVAVGGDVLAYARALSFLEESRAAFPEFVLGANGGVLKMRIKRILGSKCDAEGSPAAAIVALGMIVAVAGSYFLAVARAQAQAQATHAQIAKAATPAGIVSVSQEGTVNPDAPGIDNLHGAYTAWLEQDVRWIITPEESAAFQRLTNDEERDDFIKNFWARRDPPGAAAGTFKQEHDARIAYADEHFASDDQVGWRTDRGHIYIVYGPPESTDSHPDGDSISAYPYQMWHYRYIAGIGDKVDLSFVDTCRCGHYNLTIDRLGQPATGPGAQNGQARAILASRLLAPGGAAAPQIAAQSTAPSQPAAPPAAAPRFQYLMPGVQDGPPAVPTGISGTIVDPHGALVPGAQVTAINTDTGATMSLSTLSSGVYGFLALPPGPYNVEFEAKGFQNLLQENVQVKAGQMAGLNVKLAAGGAGQTPAAGASQEAGSISGVIVDPTGALVPRAKVTATNTDDGVQTSIVTDNSGIYSFSLRPGPYNVEVEALGFQRLLQENVHIIAGQSAKLNLKLTVGAATENVTITGKPVAAAPQPPVAAPVQQQPGRPQRVSAGVMAGLAISQPVPVYPEEAKAQHVQGVVVLHARISKDGTVKDVQVISGPPPLLVSAIDAVRQWKYKPYLLNGEPTEVETTININYTFGEAADSQGQAAPAGPAQSGVQNPLRVPAAAMKGNLVYKAEPVYPQIAKAAHVQGTVVLDAVIAKTGSMENVKVISGPEMLRSSTIDAVRQWKYDPYLLNGQPTEVETTISVSFTLAGSDSPGSGPRGASSPAAPAGPDIRSIDYKGLNSVTIQQVGERFNQDGIGLSPETPYDVARVARSAAVLKQLLAERGHPNATVTVATRSIPPGAIAIQFNVKEGPKGTAITPREAPVAEAAPPVQSATQQYDGVAVKKIGDGVAAPTLIYKVDPEFTAEAKKAKSNGVVLVNLIVDSKGLPQNVHVLRGFGIGPDGSFDPKLKKAARAAADGMNQNAVSAVEHYKFKPATEGGKPVPVALNVEINYQIF